jgi:hypothetical protein
MGVAFSLASAVLIGLAGFLFYQVLAGRFSRIKLFLGILSILIGWLIITFALADTLFWSQEAHWSQVFHLIGPGIVVSLLAGIWMVVKLPGRWLWGAAGMAVVVPAFLILTASTLSWYFDPARRLIPVQEALLHNQQVWTSNKPQRYAFTIELRCFCSGMGQFMEPIRIVVHNDEASFYARAEINEYIARYQTVDSLFLSLQRTIGEKYDSISVSYDSQLGYPTHIRLDRDWTTMDEELTIYVTDFEVLSLDRP